LIRLAGEIESSLEQIYNEQIANLPKDPVGFAQASRIAAELRLRTEVTGSAGRLTRDGDIASILAEMDVREIESLTIRNARFRGGEAASVVVEMGSDRHLPWFLPAGPSGVRVTVTGEDRQWVGGMVDYISSELAKDVPPWSWIRSRVAGAIIGLLIAVGIGGLVFSQSSEKEQNDFWGTVLPFSLAVGFLGLVVGVILISALLFRAFPAFEIVDSGASPKGRRILAAFVGIVSFGLSVAGVVLAIVAL
jgi:hypothetical protein